MSYASPYSMELLILENTYLQRYQQSQSMAFLGAAQQCFMDYAEANARAI
jgi:hypothetical protein